MTDIRFKWLITAVENGQLLRVFLRENKLISRKALADIKFKGGSITVDGRHETVRYLLNEGETVEVTFPPEEVSEWIRPVSIPLDIIFEDDHLLVINKPPYLPTIPSRDQSEESLAGAVIYFFQQKGIPSTFHAVNRLDRDTSGLLLIAKHRYVHDLFSQLQKKKKIERTYRALVHGTLAENEGIIDLPIGKKSDSIIEREVSLEGQRAVTHFSVEKRFKEVTLVKVRLETGRTHQIRVHFSHLGHPLIGDTLYGGYREGLNRQGLHSSDLSFYHPIADKDITLNIPLYNDMKEKIKTLEKN